MFFLVQSEVVFPRHCVVRVVAVNILFPFVPMKGYALFALQHRIAVFLGLVEREIAGGLVSAPVGVHTEHEGVERVDFRAFRVKPGGCSGRSVQPVAATACRTIQGTRQQFLFPFHGGFLLMAFILAHIFSDYYVVT